MKKIVLVGGGTAGHIIPNLALLPELKKNFDEIHYICNDATLDKKYLENQNVFVHPLKTTKLERKLSLKNALIPFRLTKSVFVAKKLLKDIKPNVIFSKGGFVGLPVAIAGKMLNIPVMLHESDYSLGLANKLSCHFASELLTTFEETNTKKIKIKKVQVGSPIRSTLKLKDENFAKNYLEKNFFDDKKKTILVVGGSQGSKFFNNFFMGNAQKICENFNVILITGNQEVTRKHLPENFHTLKFAKQIENFYSIADIVVTRGGSNAIFELLYLQKPMLIIPLSTENSRGDQIQNARYFNRYNLARYLAQEDCTLTKFQNKINDLQKDRNTILNCQKKYNLKIGNEKIVEEIKNILTT